MLSLLDNHTGPDTPMPRFKSPSVLFTMNETARERKLRMLTEMTRTCMACSMCELGRKPAVKGQNERDPHVLSNTNPSKVIIIGQNPGWDELEQRTPFVGQSGQNFDKEIHRNGVTRKDLYITNIVKCFTQGNAAPSSDHVERCRPFLLMEINLLRPTVVVTLGAVSFKALCPGLSYQESLGKIVESKVLNVKVFPIYHPSPMNLADATRKAAFQEQVKLMCGIVKSLKTREDYEESTSNAAH